MEKLRLIIDYLLLSKEQFINTHRNGKNKIDNWHIYGDKNKGYELQMTHNYMGGFSTLTMYRNMYRPLNQEEVCKVILHGWKSADKIFHARLAECRTK